jgi:hypothetical protein
VLLTDILLIRTLPYRAGAGSVGKAKTSSNLPLTCGWRASFTHDEAATARTRTRLHTRHIDIPTTERPFIQNDQ